MPVVTTKENGNISITMERIEAELTKDALDGWLTSHAGERATVADFLLVNEVYETLKRHLETF
jgi:hypothetical protein